MSTMYRAKVAAKALMEAWSWPTSAPAVLWGEPTKSEEYPEGGEYIFFGQANLNAPAERLRMGRKQFSEEMTLRVIIEVWQSTDDEQACEQRADELYDQVVQLFGANPTLSGTVNRMTGWTSNRATSPVDGRWRCQITVEQFIAGEVVNP